MDIEVPRELWTKFEEMPPLFYHKPRSKQDCTAAHERLIGAQQTQTQARTTKAGWRPSSPKDPVVRAAGISTMV